MPELIPFKAEHMFHVINRDSNVMQEYHIWKNKETLGPAFTGIDKGAVIGCAGIMLMWPGVGIAWCAFNSKIVKHKIWMTTRVRQILSDTIRNLRLHRVEAVVLSDNNTNIEWIEALGFTREKDIAQKYTSDRRDVIRYEYLPYGTEISRDGR